MPDIHQNDGEKGLVGEGAQPVVDPEPFVQKIGDRSEAGDGEEAPGCADCDGGHDEGQHIEGAKNGAAGKIFDQGLGQQEAEGEFDGHTDKGKEAGAPERIEKGAVEDQPPVVVDSRPLHPQLVGERVPVEEADIEHIENGQKADHRQDGQGRCQQCPSHSI